MTGFVSFVAMKISSSSKIKNTADTYIYTKYIYTYINLGTYEHDVWTQTLQRVFLYILLQLYVSCTVKIQLKNVRFVFRLGGLMALFIYMFPWDRQQDPSKRRHISTTQHGITSRNTAIFMVTAVKTWNLTFSPQVHFCKRNLLEWMYIFKNC